MSQLGQQTELKQYDQSKSTDKTQTVWSKWVNRPKPNSMSQVSLQTKLKQKQYDPSESTDQSQTVWPKQLNRSHSNRMIQVSKTKLKQYDPSR